MTHAKPLNADTLYLCDQARALPFMATVAIKFAVCVTKWSTRRRTRRALAQLEPWQLSDVGLTPEDVLKEAPRVFWRA